MQWSRIASNDLEVYRDNLRAVGCPALTVRDIILAEINDLFAHRRQSLLAGFQARFWELAIRGEAALRNEWGPPMDALSAERERLIEELLGNNSAGDAPVLAAGDDDSQQHLFWLPPGKRSALAALEEQHHRNLQLVGKAVADRADGQSSAAEQARREQMEREFEEARATLLSPAELEELRLRGSRESLWAIDLAGFEATEEEWRAVTRLRLEFSEAGKSLEDLGHEEALNRREELEAELKRATQTLLGAERYARFELAANGEFQDVCRVTQRYGLADTIAVQAYEVQQAAAAEASRLRENGELSAPTRLAALTGLRQEAERTLAKTLGEKVFATYREYSGSWLEDLDRSDRD
jgi:hypothetical protein